MLMSTYDLKQGFIETKIDSTYQSWTTGFPTYRTQKLKQLLEKHKLEVSEFVALTSIIGDVPHKEVQDAAHLFDFYKAYLPVKDLTNDQHYAIPFLAIFSKGERANSSDLA